MNRNELKTILYQPQNLIIFQVKTQVRKDVYMWIA